LNDEKELAPLSCYVIGEMFVNIENTFDAWNA
jgi:hypothetical protein